MTSHQSREDPRVAPTAAGISVRRDPSLPASSNSTDWPALARRAATTDLVRESSIRGCAKPQHLIMWYNKPWGSSANHNEVVGRDHGGLLLVMIGDHSIGVFGNCHYDIGHGQRWHDIYDVYDKDNITCGIPTGSSKSKKRFGRNRKIPKIADCSFAVIVFSYLSLCFTSRS